MDSERQKAFLEVVGEGLAMGYLSGSGEEFGFTQKGADPMVWFGAAVQERVEKHELQALVEANQDQIQGLNQRIQQELALTTADAERIGKLKTLLEESLRALGDMLPLAEAYGRREDSDDFGVDDVGRVVVARSVLAKLDEALK